jgi:hypothetical protein
VSTKVGLWWSLVVVVTVVTVVVPWWSLLLLGGLSLVVVLVVRPETPDGPSFAGPACLTESRVWSRSRVWPCLPLAARSRSPTSPTPSSAPTQNCVPSPTRSSLPHFRPSPREQYCTQNPHSKVSSPTPISYCLPFASAASRAPVASTYWSVYSRTRSIARSHSLFTLDWQYLHLVVASSVAIHLC